MLFVEVLLVCSSTGLISREMLALGGAKLPTNTSKEWSGARADFAKKRRKREEAIERLVTKYRNADREGVMEDAVSREERNMWRP